jgi:glycosyltransferase involved in cell wall biosynthesis
MAAMNDLRWPFEPLLARDGIATDWVALHGPVITPTQHAAFAELRRTGRRLVGVTSYRDFPRADARDGLDYEAVCEAWCHCFREPARHLGGTAPRALLSASDFTDPAWVARAAASVASASAFDVVYVGAVEPWQQGPKGWACAARCLPVLCHALGWRALVVGRADAGFPEQDGIVFRAGMPWRELLGAIARAHLLFAPNADDPSPRVLAEALCLNVPVLVQREILGGWKYVSPYSGAFFDDVHDVAQAAAALAHGALAPHDWFRANFGPAASARRLAALLAPLDHALRGRALELSPAGPPAPPAA